MFKIPNNLAKEIEFFKSSDEGRERQMPRKMNKLAQLNKQEFAKPGPEAELVLSPRLLITSLWYSVTGFNWADSAFGRGPLPPPPTAV